MKILPFQEVLRGFSDGQFKHNTSQRDMSQGPERSPEVLTLKGQDNKQEPSLLSLLSQTSNYPQVNHIRERV